MTQTRALLLIVLAAAAVVWVFASGAPSRSAGTRARAAAIAARPAPAVFDLRVRAERLDTRASRTTQPDARRNPFRFGDEPRVSREPQPARPMPAAITVPAASALPQLSLSGIADRTIDGKPIRIAVIAAADGLIFASPGDRVGSRYELVSIGADAVELRDVTDGSTRTLALK